MTGILTNLNRIIIKRPLVFLFTLFLLVQTVLFLQTGVFTALEAEKYVRQGNLLFETGAETELDATICVACSEATQRERLLARNWNSEQIQQRIQAQWPIEKKIAKANCVIWTESTLEVTALQLERILQKDH